MLNCLSPFRALAVLGLMLAALPLVPSEPAQAQPPDDLSLVQITSIGSRAVAVRNAGDGSNRIFIVQQSGIIWIYDLNTSTLLGTPFLNIETSVDDGGNEQGLLGLAFHPDYASNGYFYVNFTRDPGPGLDRTAIVRFQVSAADANIADSASALTIIEIEQEFSNHNGGDIHFGPDGYLYIGMGDGGSGGDPNDRAQDPAWLLGKMLRIDVNGAMETFQGRNHPKLGQAGDDLGVINKCGLVGNYDIPADNPYDADGNTCDEIWAFGLRNPWRFSFDRQTGDMLIGDVGQNAREEVNFQPGESSGGENYGWDCREGSIFHESCTDPPTFVEPIIDYAHGTGVCSVVGGFVYRGNITGFGGTYVYADVCSSQIWFATEAGGWSPTEWTESVSTPYSFGEDEAGELYISTASGNVYRFSSAEMGGIFDDDFETGDTTEWSSTEP